MKKKGLGKGLSALFGDTNIKTSPKEKQAEKAQKTALIGDLNRNPYQPRTKFDENKLNELFIIIDRKSRVVMKDAHRILETVNRIQSIEKDRHVSVLTSAPVCSKTQTFLSDNSISVKNL